MTFHNQVECDACGETVKPPQNENWAVIFKVGPDGATAVDCDGHLCGDCRRELLRWTKQRRQQFDVARSAAGRRTQ
jgi:hypothetical protein